MMPRQRSPFSLYKRGGQYIARFWSDEQQKYTVSRATGATNKGQAGRIAQQILDRGDVVPRSRDPLLLDYLTEYWKAPARRVTERYRAESARFVSKIVSEWPEGSRLRLSRVDRAALYRLQAWVAQRTTPRYANRVLQAVRVPLAVAADRGQIAADPGFRFKGIDERTERRGALTFDEVRLLIAWDGPRREHAALLLGCLSGLRLGEIRALRWASVDLKNAIIRVTESYTDTDGFAEPKANSRRLVMLHPALSPVLEDLRAESPYTEDEDFVLPQVERGRPIGYVTIRRALDKALEAIGIDSAERRARKINLHALRHTFVSHQRQFLPDFVVQAQAGHATAKLTQDDYSDRRVVDFGAYRKKLGGMYAEPKKPSKRKHG